MNGPYFTKKALICDETAFKTIEKNLRVNLHRLNSLNNELPNQPMRKFFVALMKNKSMLVDEKIERATAQMSLYEVEEQNQNKVLEFLRNSV
jgi:hypothetical protein